MTQLRGRNVVSAPPAWPAKDPAATADLGADFRLLSGGLPLDGLSASAVGCTLLESATFDSVAAVRVAGGIDRTLALVTLLASWGASSRTVQVRLPIEARTGFYDGPGLPLPAEGNGSAAAPLVQGNFVATAGDSVSGHRGVMSDSAGGVVHGDPASSLFNCLGISLNAAAKGSPVAVAGSGRVLEPSWSWTPGLAIFVGPAGALTQTPPVAGTLQQVGVALSATSMLVQPFTPTDLI